MAVIIKPEQLFSESTEVIYVLYIIFNPLKSIVIIWLHFGYSAPYKPHLITIFNF